MSYGTLYVCYTHNLYGPSSSEPLLYYIAPAMNDLQMPSELLPSLVYCTSVHTLTTVFFQTICTHLKESEDQCLELQDF